MFIKPTLVAAAVAVLCAAAPAVQAQEGMSFKFSGFGTLGIARSSEERADFVATISQPNGTGATRDIAASTDSKVGAQLDVKFSPQWSATVQGLSTLNADNNYVPSLALGFVKFAPGAGVELRAGRLPYAAFLVSDYRHIGYSQPWVRPPSEVYALSLPHIDGVDATWRTSLGSVGLKAQVLAGQASQKLATGKITDKGMYGANLTADIGEFSARVSYLHISKLTVSSASLDQVIGIVRSGLPAGALGPGAPALPGDPATARDFELKDKSVGYFSLGATYDPGNWFITGEYGHLSRVGTNPKADEFYLTAGVRIKAFTPYASIAQYKRGETLTSRHPIMAGVLAGQGQRDQSSATLGVRWDFMKSADLKIQYDRVKHDTGSQGFLINQKPGFVQGKSYNVVSAVVDFVF